MATSPIKDDLVAFDDYLRYGTDEEASKVDKTRKAYCYTVERFHRFLDGRELTPEHAREFIKALEKEGNGATSVNRHIWALKSWFRFRIASGVPASSEFKIRGLKTKKHYPRFLRDREWDRLLAAANDTIYNPEVSTHARLRSKLELALLYAYGGAGLRLSEAITLKVDDLFDEGFVRVTRKGGREDFVPMEDEVLRGIRDYIESRGNNGIYVFPGKQEGAPMAARTAQGIVKALCRRAGLPDVHVHSLRHTVGYQLRKLGASERDIQDVLGHQNIQTTQIYTHLVAEDLRRKLPKRFAPARQGRLDWK
ncbi:Tyrosine recombinase XerC [subsurface metagenome]